MPGDLDVGAMNTSPTEEHARFFRPAALPGVEMLHATFVRHRYTAHIHDSWVVACVDRGAASFELDGTRHTAPSGSVFVIPPGIVHTGEPATDCGYTYRVLYIDWAADRTSTPPNGAISRGRGRHPSRTTVIACARCISSMKSSRFRDAHWSRAKPSSHCGPRCAASPVRTPGTCKRERIQRLHGRVRSRTSIGAKTSRCASLRRLLTRAHSTSCERSTARSACRRLPIDGHSASRRRRSSCAAANRSATSH